MHVFIVHNLATIVLCNAMASSVHLLVCPSVDQDKLTLNRWIQALKPVVPGRIQAAALPPPTVRKSPKLVHLPRALPLLPAGATSNRT
jgi:hypothetical protein